MSAFFDIANAADVRAAFARLDWSNATFYRDGKPLASVARPRRDEQKTAIGDSIYTITRRGCDFSIKSSCPITAVLRLLRDA